MKVTAPLFSFDASGTLGGIITASKWRGRQYFRTRVIPNNPRAPGQVGIRSMWQFLSQEWGQHVSPTDQATWEQLAAADNVTSFNAYMRNNIRNWRSSLAPSQMYPPTRAQTPSTGTTQAPVVQGRNVTVEINATYGATDWGTVFCRSTVTGFTPDWSNAVKVLFNTSHTGALSYTDGPLDPGTYYYNGFVFTKDGAISADTGEQTAVVS